MTADGVVHGLLIAGSVTVAVCVLALLLTQAVLVARGCDPFRPLDDEWRPRQ